MRGFKGVATAVLAAGLLVPGPARAHHLKTGHPDCVSKTGKAKSVALALGEINAHGFGGGVISGLTVPAVAGVTPTPTALEGDVVGERLRLDFIGVFGGGTTKVRPPAGVGGGRVNYSGAQRLTTASFSGHYKFTKRTMYCESKIRLRTLYKFTYYEIWLTGILTPTASKPFQAWAEAKDVLILPGDTLSR